MAHVIHFFVLFRDNPKVCDVFITQEPKRKVPKRRRFEGRLYTIRWICTTAEVAKIPARRSGPHRSKYVKVVARTGTRAGLPEEPL